jgi:topoisomerase-4 subunit A
VLRLNADSRGLYLGEFAGDDKILVVDKDGFFHLFTYDLENHFEKNILLITKYDPDQVATVMYFDAEQNLHYLKRFTIEPNAGKQCRFIGDSTDNKLTNISWEQNPQFEVEFGGAHEGREKEIIDATEFIAVKSYKAKGKRVSTFEIKTITEIEPLIREDEDEAMISETKVTPEDSEVSAVREVPEIPAAPEVSKANAINPQTPEPEEIELIDDIPFEVIRPGKDGEPGQMELIFE